ncbi:hypothetical protein ABQZ08_22905 [Xanthomonas hortorum pv. hederae]
MKTAEERKKTTEKSHHGILTRSFFESLGINNIENKKTAILSIKFRKKITFHEVNVKIREASKGPAQNDKATTNALVPIPLPKR